MSRLKQYLNQISAGKPVNWVKFLETVPKELREASNFTIEKVGAKGEYLVEIQEPVEQQLWSLTKGDTRVEAALHKGDSHQQKVSFASIQSYSLESGRFDVSVCSQDKVIQSSLTDLGKSELVIIENKENFYDSANLPIFLSKHKNINLNKADVVLGDGGQVTNGYFKRLFERYETIHCLLDYDLGGVMIYDKLVGCHGARVEFTLVDDIFNNLHLFSHQKPASADFSKAIKLCEKHGLSELKQVFLHTSRFMEQEVLLVNKEK